MSDTNDDGHDGNDVPHQGGNGASAMPTNKGAPPAARSHDADRSHRDVPPLPAAAIEEPDAEVTPSRSSKPENPAPENAEDAFASAPDTDGGPRREDPVTAAAAAPTASTAGETGDEAGEKLISAVERIIQPPEAIMAFVDDLNRSMVDEDIDARAKEIIRHFSNRSAWVGGATALPAMLPGAGTALALAAGPLADMIMLLKLEVEMCLALTALRGHDITDPDERRRAFLLAAVRTIEASKARSAILDAADVSGTAVWHYAPRRVGKLLVTAAAILVALRLSRSLVRIVPFLGMAVGASMNKVLTRRVGNLVHKHLATRPAAGAHAPTPSN